MPDAEITYEQEGEGWWARADGFGAFGPDKATAYTMLMQQRHQLSSVFGELTIVSTAAAEVAEEPDA